MNHISACQICLATDVKLYDMCNYRLKNGFENLTGFNITEIHYLRHICSYCGTLLTKFMEFRELCVRSQNILEVLLNTHEMVTTEHIKNINRHSHNLTHPYTAQLIQNCDSTIVIKEETPNNVNDDATDFDFNNYEDNDDITKDTFVKEIENIKNDEDMSRTTDVCIDDSDEEPLSKKAKKKKRRKVKKENSDIEIKSENDNEELSAVKVEKNSTVKNSEEIEHDLVVLTKQEQIDEVLLRKSLPNYLNSVYKCESCYKGFMTEATYNNHMFRHDLRAGPACCDVCLTRWPDERALKAHSLISHERKYTCKICGHVSKTTHKAKQHLSWHAGVTFRCSCGATFVRHTTYLTHVRRMHPTRACVTCGETFIGETGLKLHVKKAHRGEKNPPQQTYACERCRVHFKSKDALRRHCALTDGGCDDTLWSCAQCGDVLETEELLKEHLVTHQKARAVRTCDQCSRTFPSERLLAAHRVRSHTLTGPHYNRAPKQKNCVCEICGYKCTSASSLVQHQRRHSGEKPFHCTFCPKRFSVYQRLQIHIRTHTGERPYQCSSCPKAFKHKAALNRHDRVHTGVKPYTCPQCGKSFSQSNSMKQHCAGVHMKMYIYSRKAANKQT